jgi:hypothetical protein
MLNLTIINNSVILKTVTAQQWAFCSEERKRPGLSWGSHDLVQTPHKVQLKHESSICHLFPKLNHDFLVMDGFSDSQL